MSEKTGTTNASNAELGVAAAATPAAGPRAVPRRARCAAAPSRVRLPAPIGHWRSSSAIDNW